MFLLGWNEGAREVMTLDAPDANGVAPFNRRSSKRGAIIAIPARNEADRIESCLSALAVQRDRWGAPISCGSFSVLLLVNNSTDATEFVARRLQSRLPYYLQIRNVRLPNAMATAGVARRHAMEEAATRLAGMDSNGILLTTDADSLVAPTWYATNLSHLNGGVDCVAGYIDATAGEIVAHGATFLARGRLEDLYLRLIAEIDAICDPRLHDPWPNHRASSGASLAVTLAAYIAVGGMPAQSLGEDRAFTALLDRRGFKVRHPLDVTVTTSCRLDGRATGGAADTMRHRMEVPDAFCDEDLESATAALRRATMRGVARKAWEEARFDSAAHRLLGRRMPVHAPFQTFTDAWETIESQHPGLRRGEPLRPSDLSRQIAAAQFILRHLRLRARRRSAPVGTRPHAELPALVVA